jgi:hypothetical protein
LHIYKGYTNETHLKTVIPTGIEASMPMMHQLLDPLWKELPGLLLEMLHHHSLNVFVT